MKKYFITISNGKRMILDIFPYAIVLFFTIIAISLSATVNGVVCLFVTVCFSALLIALLPTLIRMFYDCFYYDEQKNEIILKRFRVKDRRISLSDIDKLIPKRNEDPRMGATSARNETTRATFAVKSKEGYDYFFIIIDPTLEQFFADHGIPTLKYYEEES